MSIVGEAVGRPAAGMYGQFVVTTVFVFLMFALFALPVGGRKIRLDRIGIGFSGFLRNAGWGLAAVAANIPVIVLLMVVASPVIRFLPEPTHPVQSELASNPQGVTLFIIFVLAS
ncbi:MAG TPA: hypothetical protein VM328_13255, partial [Fimbriimonadaceae bacterium]|nr:hypothetical protein [Fimbriimonadaceae bacterium]